MSVVECRGWWLSAHAYLASTLLVPEASVSSGGTVISHPVTAQLCTHSNGPALESDYPMIAIG